MAGQGVLGTAMWTVVEPPAGSVPLDGLRVMPDMPLLVADHFTRVTKRCHFCRTTVYLEHHVMREMRMLGLLAAASRSGLRPGSSVPAACGNPH